MTSRVTNTKPVTLAAVMVSQRTQRGRGRGERGGTDGVEGAGAVGAGVCGVDDLAGVAGDAGALCVDDVEFVGTDFGDALGEATVVRRHSPVIKAITTSNTRVNNDDTRLASSAAMAPTAATAGPAMASIRMRISASTWCISWMNDWRMAKSG
jgi:hypothetical protein